MVDHHQREQPVCLRLVRHERGEHLAQPDGFGAEVDPAAVALVVDQVDDGQHRVETVGQQVRRGNRERDPGRLDLGLGAGQAALHGLLGDQERPGDLGGLQPAQRPQRERHLPLQRQRRVAAGEDQLESFVLDHGVVELVHHVHDGLRYRQQLDLLGQGALAADSVDRPVAGRRHQPRTGVDWKSRCGPALGRDRERLLRRFLGLVEVTEEPD